MDNIESFAARKLLWVGWQRIPRGSSQKIALRVNRVLTYGLRRHDLRSYSGRIDNSSHKKLIRPDLFDPSPHTPPTYHFPAFLYDLLMMSDGKYKKTSRRRRSSSLLYQEPPESMEHISDQSALPNLNANWVNSKGWSPPIMDLLYTRRDSDCVLFRSMDNTCCAHSCPQNFLRHHPRSVAGDIVDFDQHHLHVWLLPHVSLGSRSTI